MNKIIYAKKKIVKKICLAGNFFSTFTAIFKGV
jgi:hypothetical protein